MNSVARWALIIFLMSQLTAVYGGVLHEAVESGDPNKVSLALEQEKENIDAQNEKGLTALDMAVRKNLLPIVEILLNAGADSNARSGSDLWDMTPLGSAAGSNSDIFKMLLERGANINDSMGVHDETIIQKLRSSMNWLNFIKKWSIKKQVRITDPKDIKILDRKLGGDYKKDFLAGYKCKPQDYYLVVQPHAGLGNRLRVLASSAIIAKLSGRKLVIDWTIDVNQMSARWNELFTTPMTMFEQSPLASEGCSLDLIKSAWEDDPIIKNRGILNHFEQKGELGDIFEIREPIIYFETTMSFKPDSFNLSEAAYKRAYRQFYQGLQPVSSAAKEIEEFKEKHFTNKFPIGIHYRSWQSGPADFYVFSDREARYLKDFIVKMKEALKDHPNAVFFLATDDQNVKEKILQIKEFEGRIVTRQERIERFSTEGSLNALVDWFLLGSTNYIIGTLDSSFSDEAAHLTKEDKKISIGEGANIMQ